MTFCLAVERAGAPSMVSERPKTPNLQAGRHILLLDGGFAAAAVRTEADNYGKNLYKLR